MPRASAAISSSKISSKTSSVVWEPIASAVKRLSFFLFLFSFFLPFSLPPSSPTSPHPPVPNPGSFLLLLSPSICRHLNLFCKEIPPHPQSAEAPRGPKGGACSSGLTSQSMVLPLPECRFQVGHVAQRRPWSMKPHLGCCPVGRSQLFLLWLTLAGREAGIVCNHLAPWETRK